MPLVVFAGKGGVGKTTTAAATALQAAGLGRKTLLLSADPARSLGDVLEVGLGRPEPVEVSAGLWAVQAPARIPAPARFLDALEETGLDPVAVEDLPGLDDLLALLAVRDQLRNGPWDLVVLDCAASAQAFRLLSMPEQLAGLLERLLPMERRIARLTSGNHPADALVTAVDRLLGELAELRSMLTSASVRLVLTPEASVLAGTRRLFTALAMSGFTVDAVVVNQIFPATDDAWLQGWARQQKRVLAEVATSFGSVPVLRVGYAAAEPRGVEALSHLAISGELAKSVSALDFQVDRTESGFTLRLSMPLARKENLDLGRRGDDLVISVDGYRRVLALPSVLRRCHVEGASLREGMLSVAFLPDPAEFPSRWM